MGRNGEGATTHVDETKLEIPIAFHGSDQDTVPKIIQQGFNRSFCGKNAVVYGKGVYFARDSSYSSNDTYSRPDADGVKRMIVCKVHGMGMGMCIGMGIGINKGCCDLGMIREVRREGGGGKAERKRECVCGGCRAT